MKNVPIIPLSQFNRMSFADMALYHGMEETAFIREVFPPSRYIWTNETFYRPYQEWYGRNYNELAKILR